MSDLFDQFPELAEPGEQSQKLPSLAPPALSGRLEGLIKKLTTPVDPRAIWRATKNLPVAFSQQQVEEACRNCPHLVVVRLHQQLLVGIPDQTGNLIYPSPHLPAAGLPLFLQENREYWVAVPDRGYRVVWYHDMFAGQVGLYAGLDAIEAVIRQYHCATLATLQKAIIQALGLPDVTYPVKQP